MPRVLVLDPVRSAVLAEVPGVSSWPALVQFLVTAPERWAVALRSADSRDYVAALRYAVHYRYVGLLVDEVLLVASDREALPWLVRAARMSAHFGGGAGVRLYLTAQRPYDVPPDVRAAVTRIVMFRTREPGDLDFLSRFTLDPSVSARVAGLAPHVAITFPPPDEGGQDEGVSAGRVGGADGAGDFSDGAEAEPDSALAASAEVRAAPC
jgi:hypothetical protein